MSAIPRINRGVLAVAAAVVPAFAPAQATHSAPPRPTPLPTPLPSPSEQIVRECVADMRDIAQDTLKDLQDIVAQTLTHVRNLASTNAGDVRITTAGEEALEAIAQRANEGNHDLQDEAVGCLHILQQMHAPNAAKHAVMDARTYYHKIIQAARQAANQAVIQAVNDAGGSAG